MLEQSFIGGGPLQQWGGAIEVDLVVASNTIRYFYWGKLCISMTETFL